MPRPEGDLIWIIGKDFLVIALSGQMVQLMRSIAMRLAMLSGSQQQQCRLPHISVTKNGWRKVALTL